MKAEFVLKLNWLKECELKLQIIDQMKISAVNPRTYKGRGGGGF